MFKQLFYYLHACIFFQLRTLQGNGWVVLTKTVSDRIKGSC